MGIITRVITGSNPWGILTAAAVGVRDNIGGAIVDQYDNYYTLNGQGVLCALAWYVSALLGKFAFSHNWGIVMVIATLHGVAACLTFQPDVRPPWQPLFPVTPVRIRLARVIFGLTTMNFIICFGMLLLAGKLGNQPLVDKGVFLILTSFLLQNTVYMAIHWAFLPASLFSNSFVEALSNPLGSILRLILPSKKKQ